MLNILNVAVVLKIFECRNYYKLFQVCLVEPGATVSQFKIANNVGLIINQASGQVIYKFFSLELESAEY